MRFHIAALPHTQVTAAYPACAFTQKVRRFCQMMKGLGHTVYLYAGAEADVPCDVLFPCVTRAEQQTMIAGKHYTEAEWDGPTWDLFNQRVVTSMKTVICPGDFICVIGGRAHAPIADAFPQSQTVEFGIGYAGTFSRYRVFESYAWMHTVYGAQAGAADKADGFWYDDVIPNQFDDTIFNSYNDGKGDYFMYVGRLIGRKGYAIAQQVCERIGARLLIAGPGKQDGYGQFLGELTPSQLNILVGKAKALFAPTIYVEPFGTVTIEAMAVGTPVITTDWGAFTETVKQGVDGYRCRTFREFVDATHNVAQLSSKIIRERAHRRFSMDVVALQYQRYFERLGQLNRKGWYE